MPSYFNLSWIFITIFIILSGLSCKSNRSILFKTDDKPLGEILDKKEDKVGENIFTKVVKGTSFVKKSSLKNSAYLIGNPVIPVISPSSFEKIEVQIRLGFFGGPYKGIDKYLYIEDINLVSKYFELDTNKLYVFHVDFKKTQNPSVNKLIAPKTTPSPYIRSIEEIRGDLKGIEYGVVESYIGRQGWGGKSQARGKIVQVHRFYVERLSIDCTVDLFLKKVSSNFTKNHLDEFKLVNGMTLSSMDIESEEGCLFAENALKNNLNVNVDFSSEFFGFLSLNSLILHKIQIEAE